MGEKNKSKNTIQGLQKKKKVEYKGSLTKKNTSTKEV